MADIFSADPVVETDLNVSFNDLVGEGQKYSDPDALAKAYANLEAHTRRVEAENAEARAKADRLEAEKNNSNQQERQREPVRNDDNRNDPPKPPKENVDIRSQIREEFEALTESQRSNQNMEKAAAKMVEQYGDAAKANEAVRRRAEDLGVNVEWLRDAAMRSPEAFYATMGLSSGQSRSTPAPNSDVRVGNSQNQKNFEYYDKLRKEDSKLYYSRGSQSEMMDNARKMGSDFYSR